MPKKAASKQLNDLPNHIRNIVMGSLNYTDLKKMNRTSKSTAFEVKRHRQHRLKELSKKIEENHIKLEELLAPIKKMIKDANPSGSDFKLMEIKKQGKIYAFDKYYEVVRTVAKPQLGLSLAGEKLMKHLEQAMKTEEEFMDLRAQGAQELSGRWTMNRLKKEAGISNRRWTTGLIQYLRTDTPSHTLLTMWRRHGFIRTFMHKEFENDNLVFFIHNVKKQLNDQFSDDVEILRELRPPLNRATDRSWLALRSKDYYTALHDGVQIPFPSLVWLVGSEEDYGDLSDLLYHWEKVFAKWRREAKT